MGYSYDILTTMSNLSMSYKLPGPGEYIPWLFESWPNTCIKIPISLCKLFNWLTIERAMDLIDRF